MSTLDRTGRECHGNAPVEALDAHCDAEDRDTLGAEIRARREALDLSQRTLAFETRVSHVAIGDVERGKYVSPALLSRIADALSVDAATQDRWHALAGHVEPGLLRALLDAPERWDAVRAVLATGVATMRRDLPAEAVVSCPACGYGITADLDDDGAYVTRRHSRREPARVGAGEIVWCDGGMVRP